MQRMNVKQLNKWMQDFLKENDDLVRIHIVFERPPSVSDFGLRVKGDDLFRLYTEIGIKENKKIYVDRSKSGLVDFHADFKELRELGVEFDITNTREIDMEVIIDKTSIEAFFFDGMYSMTNLIFPEEFQKNIQIFANDEEKLNVLTLQLTILKRAFLKEEDKKVDI